MMAGMDDPQRDFPVPERRWGLAMTWLDLCFLHWAVAPEQLAPHLPPGLTLDTWEGRAYLGVVPFRMAGVHPRGFPDVPGLSAFPELNLRTYVTAGGQAGVWFFSLDAANPVAVRLARTFFHLPYFEARMHAEQLGGSVRYLSARTHRGAFPVRFQADYAPAGPVFTAAPGSLERWLTARYLLFSGDGAGRLFRGHIDHEPWPLQRANYRIRVNSVADQIGVALEGEPHALFARELRVRAWTLDGVAEHLHGPSI